jgi:dTDP-N-acetylfucosamine:lipid II N-acetylfucosaminyltransferase
MNILHLAHDETFILFFSSIFDQLEGVTNRYLVQGVPHTPFKHVAGLDISRVVGKAYFSSPEIKEDLHWADCLVVHYLDVHGARIILKAPSRVAIVWSGWGGDYYGFMRGGERSLYGDKTKQLLDKSHIPRKTLRGRLRRFVRFIKYRIFVMPALRRVGYFSAPIKSDFALLKQSLGKRFTAEYIQLNYGSVEKTFVAGGDRCHGDNILLGNSATPSNNHLEIFKLLAVQDLAERKLIVPLSYGVPEYRDAVIEEGHSVFGERFVPVCDYMPLPDYNALIAQCAVVIMNHRRQQALGNIGAMLYRGAKVFLDEASPVYAFFKERGAHVYPTSLLGKRYGDLFNPLTEKQVAANRKVLESAWGHDAVIKNANDFVLRIEQHKDQRA